MIIIDYFYAPAGGCYTVHWPTNSVPTATVFEKFGSITNGQLTSSAGVWVWAVCLTPAESQLLTLIPARLNSVIVTRAFVIFSKTYVNKLLIVM